MVAVAPVINCIDTELEAKLGDEVTVTCDVKASPSSRSVWKWNCESMDRLTEQDNIAFNESVSAAAKASAQKMTVYSTFWLLVFVCLSEAQKKQAHDL